MIERFRKASEVLKEKKKLAEYDVELKNLATKEEQLHEMFLDGLATAEQLRSLLARNRERRNQLLQKVMELKNSSMSDRNLKELQTHVLAAQFDALAEKTLDHGLYESLLNDAQITVTSYADRVEFHTLYGDMILPRLRIHKRIWMPKWELSLANIRTKGENVIDKDTQITATYFTGTKAELADFGSLRIISR